MTAKMVRRAFVGMALVALTAAWAGAANTAEAAGIRYFVIQSSGLFEVKGSTGGRFITQPTSEFIHVPGTGAVRVVGYTDRAQRGERIVSQVTGSGLATIWVTSTNSRGQTKNLVPQFQAGLPLVVSTIVSPDADNDNITGFVRQNNATTSRRLPVGTRP